MIQNALFSRAFSSIPKLFLLQIEKSGMTCNAPRFRWIPGPYLGTPFPNSTSNGNNVLNYFFPTSFMTGVVNGRV